MPNDPLRRILDLIELQKFDLAIREARQVLKKDPENAVAHYLIAWSLWKLGRLKEAIKSDKKALSIDPEYAYAHSLMGELLDQIRKLKKARPYHQKALQLMPNEVDFYVGYSIHLYRCFPSDASAPVIYPHTPLWHDWENAVKLLGQALKLNPNHAGAYRLRAICLLAVLVFLPFLCAYAMDLPVLGISYMLFLLLLFVFLNTIGNYWLTQAVIRGWLKI